MDVKIMMKMSVTAGIITLLLVGCSTSVPREINPPKNAQWITVKGKVPPHTKPYIFRHYTSPTCQFKTINMGSGARGKENYKLAKFADIDFNEKTGEFNAKVPVDGGTRCHWSLKSLNIGVEYLDTQHLIKNKSTSSGNDITIKIKKQCDNDSSVFLQNIAVFSDYYPLHYSEVTEEKNKNHISLVNIKSKDEFGSYNEKYSLFIPMGKNSNIIFTPSIHENFIVKQFVNKKKLHVQYPDGSTVKGTNTIKPYPKDKLEKALKEQKRLQESMGIFPIDTSKNPEVCKNL